VYYLKQNDNLNNLILPMKFSQKKNNNAPIKANVFGQNI
jgi:hypothetical protein